MEETDGEASYEIQMEGEVECDDVAVAAVEVDAAGADAPKDNGEVPSTGAGKKSAKKPADDGDAEADEHDFVVMPSMRVVTNDLSGLNEHKCFVVHTLSIDDLDHPTITSLLRNPACSDFKLQFSRSSDEESNLLGVMSVRSVSSKQAAAAMSAIRQIREDLVVESLKPSNTMASIVQKWKTDHSISNKAVTGEMVIVKNLDAEAATIEKLTEIFPDAEDITVSSHPLASYLGKLKGTKVAYVIFADQQTAAAVVEHAYANPVELNGRQLIIRHYTEPPHHVPEGYMRLTTRRLVLRQIAHARGLIARAQEDPTYDLPKVWHARLTRATELIEKDDAARDMLGMAKPTLVDFKDISLQHTSTQKEIEHILFNLGIGDDPGQILPDSRPTKRGFGPSNVGSEKTRKVDRGAVSKPVSLLSTQFSRPRPGPSRVMMSMRGRKVAGFDLMPPEPSYPLPSPRAMAMRARARSMRGLPRDYFGW